MGDRLLTLAEVAERLKVPLDTVYRWRQTRQGPPGYRIGRHIRVKESDLEAWIEQRREVLPA